MAAKPLPSDIVERVIADWRTGEYSQRQLADKHKISTGKVANLTKGLEKDCEQIVSAGIAYKSGLARHDERIVSAINEAVDYKVRVAGLANTFAEKAILKATSMLDTVEDALSIKHLSDAVDRNTITAGVNERHAKPTTITNTTQTANFSGMSNDDIKRRLKEIDERVISD